MIWKHICLLTIPIIVQVVQAEQSANYVTISEFKEMIAEATSPLLDRIEKLETKVAVMEAHDRKQRAVLQDQETLMKQYQAKLLQVEKMAISGSQHCLSIGSRLKSLEKMNNKARLPKSSVQPTPDLPTKSVGNETKQRLRRNAREITVTEVEETMNSPQQVVEHRRRAIEIPVAFQAVMKNNLDNISHSQDIVFDTVITNLGNAYHASHGVFFAPVTGVYVFGVTIMSEPGRNIHCSLAVNGKAMTQINAKHNPNYDQVATSLVVRLNKGDDVSVRNQDAGGNSVFGGAMSSFNGFLLTEDFLNVAPVG